MKTVSLERKVAASAVAPTETPRKMVRMLQSSFCAVLERRSVTPQTLNRLPSIRKPTSGAASGTSRTTNSVTTIGKTTFSTLETGRRFAMTTERSFLVVSSFMKGG